MRFSLLYISFSFNYYLLLPFLLLCFSRLHYMCENVYECRECGRTRGMIRVLLISVILNDFILILYYYLYYIIYLYYFIISILSQICASFNRTFLCGAAAVPNQYSDNSIDTFLHSDILLTIQWRKSYFERNLGLVNFFFSSSWHWTIDARATKKGQEFKWKGECRNSHWIKSRVLWLWMSIIVSTYSFDISGNVLFSYGRLYAKFTISLTRSIGELIVLANVWTFRYSPRLLTSVDASAKGNGMIHSELANVF